MSNVIHTIEGWKEAQALADLDARDRLTDRHMIALDDAVEAVDEAVATGQPLPISRWEQARIAWAQEQLVQRRKKRAGRKLRIVR